MYSTFSLNQTIHNKCIKIYSKIEIKGFWYFPESKQNGRVPYEIKESVKSGIRLTEPGQLGKPISFHMNKYIIFVITVQHKNSKNYNSHWPS